MKKRSKRELYFGKSFLSIFDVLRDPRTGTDRVFRADQFFGPWIPDLNRGRYRSDQIEKNVEKWFKKILKHLYDYSCPGDLLIKLTRVILIKVKDLNLNRILGPLIGGWVTELLQKSVAAKNHTIYLSIIALFLR